MHLNFRSQTLLRPQDHPGVLHSATPGHPAGGQRGDWGRDGAAVEGLAHPNGTHAQWRQSQFNKLNIVEEIAAF